MDSRVAPSLYRALLQAIVVLDGFDHSNNADFMALRNTFLNLPYSELIYKDFRQTQHKLLQSQRSFLDKLLKKESNQNLQQLKAHFLTFMHGNLEFVNLEVGDDSNQTGSYLERRQTAVGAASLGLPTFALIKLAQLCGKNQRLYTPINRVLGQKSLRFSALYCS